jgi:hypothetical protein
MLQHLQQLRNAVRDDGQVPEEQQVRGKHCCSNDSADVVSSLQAMWLSQDMLAC